MRQAAVHVNEAKTEQVIKGLGIRIHKVTILNENDRIKVKQKGWSDKKDGAEINDTLRVQGFAWLSNGIAAGSRCNVNNLNAYLHLIAEGTAGIG